MKHNILMVIGCSIPLLLIFLLPAVGVESGKFLVFAIVAMFSGHLIHLGMHKQTDHESNDHEHHH